MLNKIRDHPTHITLVIGMFPNINDHNDISNNSKIGR